MNFNAHIVLFLDWTYHNKKGMALKIKRHKNTNTVYHDNFKMDSTKVIYGRKTHYVIELEILNNGCEFKYLNLQCRILNIMLYQSCADKLTNLYPILVIVTTCLQNLLI